MSKEMQWLTNCPAESSDDGKQVNFNVTREDT